MKHIEQKNEALYSELDRTLGFIQLSTLLLLAPGHSVSKYFSLLEP